MIDIVIYADGIDGRPPSPFLAFRTIAPDLQEPVRSVVVIDRATGLTGTYRNDQVDE